MIYYDPEKYGLETVAEYDAYDEDYSFHLIVVWRETDTGKLWAAADSGCSCPTPFEDHTFPTDFTEVRRWEDVFELLNAEYPRHHHHRHHRRDHSNLRRAVQRALAV